MLRATVLPRNPLKQKKAFVLAAQKALKLGKIFVPPNNANLISIVPSKMLPISLISGSSTNLRTAFNQGYEDTVNNPELEELFSTK